MKQRYVLCSLVMLLALPAQAQFLGDSLAAAGFNITEEEAVDALAALASQRAAREPSTPAPAPQPPMQAVVTPAPSEPLQPLPPMTGQAFGAAGGGKVSTPQEASEWKSSFVPAGTTVQAPPAGSEKVQVRGGTLQYSRGIFYQQKGSEWVVVPAPVGARVKDRPAAASLISYGGSSYLYYNGAFFVWNGAEQAADVVAPPAGAVVTNIPETAVKEDRGGKPCYVYGGTCFRPTFRGSTMVYVVS